MKGLLLTFVAVAGAVGATITVDRNDPSALYSLGEAAARLQPGDTLWIAPGSGPYREELFIRASGTPEAPIRIEGNGNEITGFDPLVFENGVARPPVKYPFVLRHKGKRVPEATPGHFGATLVHNPSDNTLALNPGADSEAWEISSRKFAVRIQDASHQIYREITASGSLNDGFNLHGRGEGLVFEKVTGCQNLDEGFSSHGTIQSLVRNSRFYENDNGMLSGHQTVTQVEDCDFFENLGIGLGFNGQASVDARRVRSWQNGMVQFLLREGVDARLSEVEIFHNSHASRPWVTYCETASRSQPVTAEMAEIPPPSSPGASSLVIHETQTSP